MGMSASQARMLSLTSRMSDLELKAQAISNSKIRLADESEAASRAYSEALDKQKLTVFSGVDNNGNSSYIDATALNLTAYNSVNLDHQRFIKDSAGRVLVTTKVANSFNFASNEVDRYLHDYPTTAKNYDGSDIRPTTYDAYKNLTLQELMGDSKFIIFVLGAEGEFDASKGGYRDWWSSGALWDTFKNNPENTGKLEYYKNQFLEMLECGYQTPGDDNMKNGAWLEAQVNAGNIFLSIYDSEAGANGTGDFIDVSWTSGDASIQEKDDKTELARAESKYETTMADIQSKDKRFDLQLKEIDTEHSAIQTEVDSVKKIVDKNIERSFKTFNA